MKGRRAEDRVTALVAVGGAMLLAAVATWKGPGLSIDSVGYLSTGVNLADSQGLVGLADQPLTIFPPGLPALAALGELIGIGGEAMLRILSVVSFGIIVALGNHLIRSVVSHRGLVTGATVLLAVSPALLGVSKMAWSEPPFIVVSLLFLLLLERIWGRGELTARDVIALAAVCWIAFLLRYAGTSLIAAGGLVLLFAVRPLDRRTIGRIIGFGVLSASLPVLWLLRNHRADGTYTGPRSPSQDSLWDVAVRTGAVVGEWLVPVSGMAERSLALIGVVGSLLAVVGLAAAIRHRPGAPVDARARRLLLTCTIFAVVYVSYLTVAAISTSFEPINSRYLSPVYVPAVLIGVAGVAVLWTRRAGRGWPVVIGTVAVLLVAGQGAISVGDVRDGASDGIGYNADGWSDSELAAVAVSVVGDAADPIVYSNDPNGLWAATRLQPIRWAPRDIGFRGAPLEGELDAFVEQAACSSRTTYLVYFFAGSPRVVSLEEIRSVVDVERVAGARDGALLRVSAEATAPCSIDEPRTTRSR